MGETFSVTCGENHQDPQGSYHTIFPWTERETEAWGRETMGSVLEMISHRAGA